MKAKIPEHEVEYVLNLFDGKDFSTHDFIILYKSNFPATWKNLESSYGAGGKGAKTHYSAYSRISHLLNNWSQKNKLFKLEYRKADQTINWGHPLIRFWTCNPNKYDDNLYPDEVSTNNTTYHEGASTQVLVNKYERDPAARADCIMHHGLACQVCNFDFEKKYGIRGKDFIHVHHRVPVSTFNGSKPINPKEDLIPVCPNCHAMLHRKNDGMTIEALREILKEETASK